MTLRHLKIFVTVCEVGNVTKAGEKLYISQPSVSLAISELEENYGIKLFDRISKRLHITEAGKSFLQYATHIVSLFDDMEKTMKNFDAIGVLNIGASITIGNCMLPNFINEYKKKHPNITIKVSIDNSDRIEQHILTNKIDIGLIEGTIRSPYIKSEVFLTDKLVIISSTTHPFATTGSTTFDNLIKENFILREKGSAGRESFDNILSSKGIAISPIWESVSTNAIIEAVKSNLGISLLPYLLVKDYVEKNKIAIIDIDDLTFNQNCSIIYHKNKYISQGAKDFINIVKSTK